MVLKVQVTTIEIIERKSKFILLKEVIKNINIDLINCDYKCNFS
jgi:hypothetical protein